MKNINILNEIEQAYHRGFKAGQKATFDYLVKAGGYERFHKFLVDVGLVIGNDEVAD